MKIVAVSGSPLERKIGGAVVVARRAGQNFTLAQLFVFGREKGEIENDAEGVMTLQNYAGNLRWLLGRLK